MESTQTIKFDALVVDSREKPGGNRDNVLSLWDNNEKVAQRKSRLVPTESMIHRISGNDFSNDTIQVFH